MSFISEVKVKGHIYLYECVSYRNENKQPRLDRKNIGYVDEQGNRVYTEEYILEQKSKGIILKNPTYLVKFSFDDLIKSTLRSYGLFYFFKNIGQEIKLIDSLKYAFPDTWQELFTMACYMVATNEPFMYCEDWVASTETFEVKSNLSSQYISFLFKNQKAECRDRFYRHWFGIHKDNEYAALDITSESSYSNLIGEVEYGYNRDGEDLPQVNHCMLIGETTRLPIIQDVFQGSIRDVSTLETFVIRMEKLLDEAFAYVRFVTDKGFYSRHNIDVLLEKNIEFLIAMPFTSNLSAQILDEVRPDIEKSDNAININGNVIMGKRIEVHWDESHVLFANVYYNPLKALEDKMDLLRKVAYLRELVESTPELYFSALRDEDIHSQIEEVENDLKKQKKKLKSQILDIEESELLVPIEEVREYIEIKKSGKKGMYNVNCKPASKSQDPDLQQRIGEIQDLVLRNPGIYYSALYNDKIYNEIKEIEEEAVKEKEELAKSLRNVDAKQIESYSNDVRRYLKIQELERGSRYVVSINDEEINNRLKSSGWLILLCKNKISTKDGIAYYRNKDVVEKIFLRSKNNIDLKRLRVHGSEAMQAKVFVGFIASVLMAHINNVMSQHDLYRTYTMTGLLKKLFRLNVMEIKDTKIVYPCTKEQKEIFEYFNMPCPETIVD